MKFHRKIFLKYIRFPHSREHGFTLIEVIVTLVILAIVAATAITYFQTTFVNSTTPYTMTQEQYHDTPGGDPESDDSDPGVVESIERIVAEYNSAENTQAGSDFQNNLLSSANVDAVSDLSITVASLDFKKVVVRKNNQRIIAFFPVF